MIEPCDAPRMPASERERALLRSRAVRYACETEQRRQQPAQQLLQIRLGGRESYGIPYPVIEEVSRARGLTRVPGLPPFMVGVVARKGELMSVADLGVLLGLPSAEGEELPLVVVRAAGITLGLLVGEIEGSRPYRREELSSSQRQQGSLGPGTVHGVLEGAVAVLNMEVVMDEIRVRLERVQ